MTNEEFEIVKMIDEVWNKFRELPHDEPAEASEFCIAVHALQYKIMARQIRRSMKEQEREMHEPRDNI